MPDNLLDEALADFPRTEIWRIQTDGWQGHLGKGNFDSDYYEGMNAAFDFIRENDKSKITPGLIEGIYHSAFKFNKDYLQSHSLQAGYSTEYGDFPIYFPYPGLENTAGVSNDGIDNLVSIMEQSRRMKGERSEPNSFICIHFPSRPYFCIPVNPIDEYKNTLGQHLHPASLTHPHYNGDEKSNEKKRLVLVASARASREEIIHLVQTEIQIYYQQIAAAETAGTANQVKAAKIAAINRLVQRLHIGHYFGDGNGRTFVFLLANLLLLQNGLGLKITQTPAHYAAYSEQELLAETTKDLERYQEYLVTSAKEYLIQLTSEEIKDKAAVNAMLNNLLSSNPLTAMAQINELYLRIKANDIIVPQDYRPVKKSLSYSSLFSPKDNHRTHKKILDILILAYHQNLLALPSYAGTNSIPPIGINNLPSVPNEKPRPAPSDVFEEMVAQHEISHAIKKSTIYRTISEYYERMEQSHSATTTTTSTSSSI